MKKKLPLFFAVAVVALLSSNTFALEMDYSGEFRLRNQNRELTYSNADRRNQTNLRARANFNLKIREGLSFAFTPQVTNNFGQIIASTNDPSSSSHNSSGDKYHVGVNIFEAYVLSQGKTLSYKIGRQQFGYGDNVILGRRNWTTTGQTFDAVKLMFNIGEGQLDLAYSKISEGTNKTSTKDDVDLAFLYYKILMRNNINFDVYLIHNNKRQVLETNSYGFRLKGMWKNISYRTENIFQYQQRRERTEHNIEGELGYKFAFGLKTYAGWRQTSSNYDQLYTNHHAWNGMIDMIGRRNLETIFAGANYKFNKSWNVKFKWMTFKQKTLGFGAYNQAASSVISGDTSKANLGNEFDLAVNYQKNQYEALKLGASLFSHGNYFQGNRRNSTFLYLQYQLKY